MRGWLSCSLRIDGWGISLLGVINFLALMERVMKFLGLVLLFLVSAAAHSSLPIKVSDEELVKNTDHMIIGRVVGVEMIDKNGKKITDVEARTGPSLTNIIRLVVEVESVVLTNAKVVPPILKVPLDPFMHFSLGQIKEAHAGKQTSILLLLKGANFEPPFPGVFRRDLLEKEKLLEAIKSNQMLQQ